MSAYGEGVHELTRGDFENLLAFRTSLRRFLHWSQTQASAVELVDRAAAAGLVERRGDADDGRVTRVGLTADGEARLGKLAPAHLDELRSLAPVLDHLVAGWAAHNPDAPGARR